MQPRERKRQEAQRRDLLDWASVALAMFIYAVLGTWLLVYAMTMAR